MATDSFQGALLASERIQGAGNEESTRKCRKFGRGRKVAYMGRQDDWDFNETLEYKQHHGMYTIRALKLGLHG